MRFSTSRSWLLATASSGCWIVEFVRESSRQLPQRSQAVALLLHPSGFADPVGHHSHQTLSELGHAVHEFRKNCEAGKRRAQTSVIARAA